MSMYELLFKNLTVVTMDDAGSVLYNACIAVEGGKIAYIGDELPGMEACRVIDGAGKIAMPGLINTHTHAYMSLMRGFADDYVLQEWLNGHVFPVESRITPEDAALGAQLAMAEMLASGTVSFTDMTMHLPAVMEAVEGVGLYGNLSNGAMSFDEGSYCFDTDKVTCQTREAISRFHNADGGRLKVDASIHAEYTSFPRLWREYAAFARDEGLNMHVHLSETRSEHENCVKKYGKTPAALLAEHGVFDPRATAAHCVWITPADMELLAEKGVTVAHCPVGNLKLASGVAPAAHMLEKGVNVALGTDGVCSNNNHDLFEEIKTSALLQKGMSGDPRVVPAPSALYMATRAGAYAQGREACLGQLKAGFDATLILLDAARPGLFPVHNPQSTLAYSARGGDVAMTVIRGKVLYENGVYTTVDVERLQARFGPVMERIFRA